MLTPTAAHELATDLSRAARRGGPDEWRAAARRWVELSGRELLLVDAAARSFGSTGGLPVSGTEGWIGPQLEESSGFVAAVASLHASGRIREEATLTLGRSVGTVAATALALRTMDHVPQVRAAALAGLGRVLDLDVAAPVLGVVLAGRRRHLGRVAEASVVSMLEGRVAAVDLRAALMRSTDRLVRRWAVERSHESGALTRDDLLAGIRSERDQLILSWFADWIASDARPEDFATMLTARSVDVRQVAITRIPDELLSDANLHSLLTDRAPRIRDAARVRARRRGIDVAGWCRHELDGGEGSPTVRAGCLDGLAALGDTADVDRFVSALADPSSRVRSVAAAGVAARAPSGTALVALRPLLLDPSPRVATAAARAMARAGAAPAHCDDAWASAQVWSRRAAWRVMRASGRWNRVEADLLAATDSDSRLSGLGRSGLLTWLHSQAATTWDVLPSAQRDRIGDLLSRTKLSEADRRLVTFHAGLLVRDARPDVPDTDVPRRAGWRRLLRRG